MSSGGVSELGASSGRHDRDLSAGGGGTYAAATAGLAVSAASVLIGAVATWRFILWRARTRLQDTVKRVQDLLPTDGPLIDLNNSNVTKMILDKSMKRASKWMTLREEATMPMVGQVGGRSHHKRPLLMMKSGAGLSSKRESAAGASGKATATCPPDDDRRVHIEDHEYVLKPLVADHRGIREVAFYEAIEVVMHQTSKSKPPSSATTSSASAGIVGVSQAYAQFLSGGDIMGGGQDGSRQNRNHQQQQLCLRLKGLMNVVDTVALALAMMFQDIVIQKSEEELKRAWKAVKREADSLHRLSKFVPRCRGIVRIGMKQRQPSLSFTPANDSAISDAYASPVECIEGSGSIATMSQIGEGPSDGKRGDKATLLSDPSVGDCHVAPSLQWTSSFGLTDDSYLLLQSLTRTYARPCVMDLKMGTETFEPDCSDEKRRRESSKYAMQGVFGFRIIGMRIYDPDHQESDDKGFRLFPKHYGRSLLEREQVVEAFRLFFGSGVKRKSAAAEGAQSQSLNGSANATSASSVHHRRMLDDEDKCSSVRTKAVSSLLLQLRSLRRWFEEHNTALQFRASSLLFIYEGDPTRGGNGDVTMLKMIDFGHVRRAPGGDTGYLNGIKNLTLILTEILTYDEVARPSTNRTLPAPQMEGLPAPQMEGR